MSQGLTAILLGVKQATISRWEAGKSPIPDNLDDDLGQYEEALAVLVDEAAEAMEHRSALHDSPVIEWQTYTDDEAFWAADARARDGGWPAVLHRLAAAHAAWMVRAEFGVEVELV